MSGRSTLNQSKDFEREAGEILGARRFHAGEWSDPGDADLDGGWFLAQCKHRCWPDWFRRGADQIEEATAGTDKLPLLIYRDKQHRGNKKARIYVAMPIEVWVAWNGRGDDAAQ